MFTWSDESILWYQAASEWTGYHALLAREASDFLDSGDEVCDVGCGPGCLAMELASAVRQVTAVDIDERVLQRISDKTAERGIRNVRPVLSDYRGLPDNCCDVLVACSFGVLEKTASDFLRLARKRMIIIKRKNSGTEEVQLPLLCGRGYKAYDDEEFLNSLQISYRLHTFGGDFGQPLHDREEAFRFLEHYGFDEREPADRYLERCRIADPGCEYRYYIPNKKEVHMLVIEKADLMELNQSDQVEKTLA